LAEAFERGATPVEVPEMQSVAKQIVARLQLDEDQYNALLKSIGEPVLADFSACAPKEILGS
jgi:predicted negative regulator of RcsB-dependent stress response